jgi:hypothetical protein
MTAQHADAAIVTGRDGRGAGQDARGCLQSGQFALIDERYDLYEVAVTVLGCPLAGSYSGLASLREVYWGIRPGMTVSVDDGTHAFTISLEL